MFGIVVGLLGICLSEMVFGAGSEETRLKLRPAETTVAAGQGSSSGKEQFQPLLSTVSNNKAAQDLMIANTYRVEAVVGSKKPAGSGQKVEVQMAISTAFRLHKNWFLTCAHGLFDLNKRRKSVVPVKIDVRNRPDAPSPAAPFIVVVDTPKSRDEANGKIFFFDGKLNLNSSNTGRGRDLALIYVSDEDLSASALKPADDFMKSVRGLVPEESLSAITKVKKQASSQWEKFIRHPIPDFHLFILSERTIIDELTPFPLTTYYIQKDKPENVTTFVFKSKGTRRGTDAIFYERVNNLIGGTSGAPMTYGNYVVSVDSATNCSPMLTDKFYEFLKRSMGKDYSKGMCVRPVEPDGPGVPVYGKNDKNWNDGRPQK